MAKRDNVKDTSVDEQDILQASDVGDQEILAENSSAEVLPANNSIVLPEAAPQLMPVDAKQESHDAIISNVHPAFLPGRTQVSSFQGLMGEIENAFIAAEEKAKHASAAALNQILISFGALRNHIVELEKTASDNLKNIFAKIISFLSK